MNDGRNRTTWNAWILSQQGRKPKPAPAQAARTHSSQTQGPVTARPPKVFDEKLRGERVTVPPPPNYDPKAMDNRAALSDRYSVVDQAAIDERERKKQAKQNGEMPFIQEIFNEAEFEWTSSNPYQDEYNSNEFEASPLQEIFGEADHELEDGDDSGPQTLRSPGTPPPTVRQGQGQPQWPPVDDTEPPTVPRPRRSSPPPSSSNRSGDKQATTRRDGTAARAQARQRNRPARRKSDPPSTKRSGEISLLSEIFSEVDREFENNYGF